MGAAYFWSFLLRKVCKSQFRLHPKGHLGISEGCITIENMNDWTRIRAIFSDAPKVSVPGSALKAYAELIVS
ncbi:DUF2778 domain-containing protein [Trinickia terrae]|uniref:DUF2778 domain-containing protein n=1 Tax=Trinickia terrae TaxID=2571161 RepID=A0A4U1ICZ9_9BURK|nr:tlde1 domain-containing protein [Trinickia terrae]TKC91504.1 DUF2778 domain-containing protein [Trinickia terrae]